MSIKAENKKIKKIRNICIENAEAFLSVTEKHLDDGNVNHICYHLALLGLEEVGKLILATIDHINNVAGKERPGIENASDDHKKKIFWAIWGGDMLRNNKYTKESIEQSRHLADSLHERRLDTLYTDTKNPLPVCRRIERKEAKMIIDFTRARLELEKTQELVDFEKEDIKVLTWFFEAVEDVEKKKQIFSATSIKKLQELKNGKEWIKWLYDLYKKNDEDMKEYAVKELNRKEPQGKEREKPKYLMRLRIQTPSHSIRGNAFVNWNENFNGIKIYISDRKDLKKIAKGEILIDISFPKSTPPHRLWEEGMFMSKTIIIGFNIATLGIFWWNVQKDEEKYYEYIKDLEQDPKGNVFLNVVPQKRLTVGFDDAKLVLDNKVMKNVNMINALLLREHKSLKTFLEAYALGLTLFSKTDIHLRLEVNSFEQFYKAFKAVMIKFGDWDGQTDFIEAVKKQYEKIGEIKDLEKTLKLGEALEQDLKKEIRHPITLTEVIAIKSYSDYYIKLKANKYFQDLDKNMKHKEDGKNKIESVSSLEL